ncbi:MAG TPA: hypothetical protein VGN42_21630 [Pirellulales bacterium]|jgi:hypothetical protein|nr:hypothetical protein [Pirellulales bacterium]
MKWMKTAALLVVAFLVAAITTFGFLRAQQPGAGDTRNLPGAADAPQPKLGQTGFGPPAPASAPGVSPVPQPPAVNPNGVQGGWATIPQPYGAAEPDDPEMAELRQADVALMQESEQLVAQYAATEDQEKRAALKTQLAESLAKHFDTQQQLRERELARVEARIKKLRELTQKRRDAQRTIVEQRLDQLLREADGLGWTPPGNSPYGAPATHLQPKMDYRYNSSPYRSDPVGFQQSPASNKPPLPQEN